MGYLHGGIIIIPRQTWKYTCSGNICLPSSNDNDDDDNVARCNTGSTTGKHVQRIRLRRDFLSGDDGDDRRALLDKLGFVWDFGEYNFGKFVRALHYYDRLSSGMKSGHDIPSQQQQQQQLRRKRREYHHSVRVPTKFIVPTGIDSGWPTDLWDYPLGARTMAVRQKQLYIRSHPRRKQILEGMKAMY